MIDDDGRWEMGGGVVGEIFVAAVVLCECVWLCAFFVRAAGRYC